MVGKFFPVFLRGVKEYVFIFFAAVSIFCLVFLSKFAPETKGRTFAEIEAEFAKLNGTAIPSTIEDKSLKRENGTEH